MWYYIEIFTVRSQEYIMVEDNNAIFHVFYSLLYRYQRVHIVKAVRSMSREPTMIPELILKLLVLLQPSLSQV